MKILLDTHVWIWSHLAPDRMGRRLAQHILDPANQLWLSPISLWEFLVLVEKKRLTIREDPADDKFLFLAQDGRARTIISGDNDSDQLAIPVPGQRAQKDGDHIRPSSRL